jgi:hypothetical protein
MRTLEILNFPFVLLGSRSSCERPEIAALSCLGIFLSGIQAILTVDQFADHDSTSLKLEINSLLFAQDNILNSLLHFTSPA